MTRAVGYVRVSTQDQADNGLNLAEDRERVRELCEAKGWELVELFDDGAAQGDDPNRPALLALLDAASAKQFDVLVIRSIERLSRDPMIHGLATNAFRAAGVQVESFITGPIDIETPQGEFTANLFAAMGKFEKRLTGQRVKQAMRARTRAGVPSGGTPRYGLTWDAATRTAKGGATALVAVQGEAKVVVRIYTNTASGRSQRAIQRALNAECVPAPGGGLWQQSAIARILADPIYVGKLTARHDGKSMVVEGSHDPIVTPELWDRVQAIRAGGSRRKGGQHSGGAHLLVRGALRCGICGSAMIPDHGRKRRDRYLCRGRVEHGSDFCSQGSMLRVGIDEPLLSTLVGGYIDLDAMRRRIEERTSSALGTACDIAAQAEREAAKAEAKLSRVRGHYQEGKLAVDDWNEQRAELTAQLEAAQGAAQRAQEHVQQVEQAGVPDDAEQTLLDHLAALKKAVGDGVADAPDLHALRNVIADMFESITLVRGDDTRWEEDLRGGAGLKLSTGNTYWMVPKLRSGRLDWEAGGVVRRELDVPVSGRPETDAPSKVTG
jgi:site-specific DNA recombinase